MTNQTEKWTVALAGGGMGVVLGIALSTLLLVVDAQLAPVTPPAPSTVTSAGTPLPRLTLASPKALPPTWPLQRMREGELVVFTAVCIPD